MTPPRTGHTPLPAAFRLVWTTILLLSLASLLFCLREAHATHLPAQQFFFTYPSLEQFGDFTLYLEKFKLIHTRQFFTTDYPFTYPAPVAVAYNFFFHHTGAHPTRAFLVFSLLALVLPAALFARALLRNGVAPLPAVLFPLTLVLTSWPAILVLDRANMEIIVWIALALGTWAWATGRLYLAAAAFALAAALKLFPFVFFGLFLSVRDLRRILFGAVLFLLTTLASLAFLGPSIPVADAAIRAGLDFFRVNYMAVWHPIEATVDHSLFNLYKSTAVLVFHHSPGFLPSLGRFLPAVALLGILLYFLRIRTLPLVNQLLCLAIASIYFTAFSGDGTLLHLYYPFALILLLALGRARAALPQPRGLTPILLTLTLLLTPKTFLLAHTRVDLSNLVIPVTPLRLDPISHPTTPPQLSPAPAPTLPLSQSVSRIRIDGPVHAALLAVLLGLALLYPIGPTLSHSRRTREPLLTSLLHPTP